MRHSQRLTWRYLLLGLLALAFTEGKVQAQEPAQAMTLSDCIAIGLDRQPSVRAARASLASAETQRRALDHLKLASLVSRELPIRRQQAEQGVTIACAGVQLAESETVYAVSRNYFSLIYARKQEQVARAAIEKLEKALGKARELVKKGLLNGEVVIVTEIDVDRLAVTIELNRGRHTEASQGIERAAAALREAMGVERTCPLSLFDVDLPALVEGLNKEELISMALARRPELVQAASAVCLTELEVSAQKTVWLKPTARTFASGSDIHSKQIPQGSNGTEYRPGAIGIEMPTLLVGMRGDRVQRAQDLSGRAGAVVEKTQNLIVLEAEDSFHKWQEAALKVKSLAPIPERAAKVAKFTEGRFDLGTKVSGEELLRAQTLFEQAQSEYNQALYHQALALAALERITAGGYTPSYRAVAIRQP